MSKEQEIEELAELLVKTYINGTLNDTPYADEYRRRAKIIIEAGYTRANQTKADGNKEISKIIQALGLLNSMVISGESHSDISRKMIDEACEAVINISSLPQPKADKVDDVLADILTRSGAMHIQGLIDCYKKFGEAFEQDSSLPQSLVPIDEQEALNYAEEVCKKCIEISPTTTKNTIALAVAKAFCQRFGQTRVPGKDN